MLFRSFEDPYRYCNEERSRTEVFTASNRAEARAIAAQSLVLLNNQGGLLPLKKTGTIAVVGPLADNRVNMTGTWSVAARFAESVSLMDGLKAATGDKAKLLYALGSNLYLDPVFQQSATPFGKTIPRDERPAEVLIEEAVAAAQIGRAHV